MDVAMQVRCPTCLGEQWALTVLPFSYGQVGCTVCGEPSKVMTEQQWRDALAAARRRGAAPDRRPGFRAWP